MKKKKTNHLYFSWLQAERKIFCLFFVLILLLVNSPNSLRAQEKEQSRLSLHLQNMPLQDIFATIQNKSNYRFLFNANDVSPVKGITLNMDNATVDEILNTCFKSTELRYKVEGNYVYVFSIKNLDLIATGKPTSNTAATTQQPTTIGGKIVNEKNEPLPGVSVVARGVDKGTTSNINGEYTIVVPAGTAQLSFSAIGYAGNTVDINGRNSINMSMVPAKSDLDEVVVTGYMTQKKADLTGAISVVSTQDINKNHGTTNVLEALQGVVPGMSITTDGNPTGSNVSVQIRGMTSINGASPLIVLDGVPTHMNLRDINPNNIASMQVLKDAASASIYGAQGGAGVILIETKKGKAGKAQISYNGMVGYSRLANRLDMMNTQQYGQALWQAAVNSNVDPNLATQIYSYDWHKNDQGIPVLDKVTPRKYLNADSTMIAGNTNWVDAIMHKGIQTDHQLTVSGGGEKSTSLFSIDYFENKGIQLFTGYQRFTARFNSTYRLLNNHLVIGENVEASHLKLNDQNVMHDAMVEPPIIPVHTTNGGWGGSAVSLGMDDYWNPVRELTLNKDNFTSYNKMYGNVFAELSLFNHLTFKSQFGLVYTDGYLRNIQFTFKEGGGKFQPINDVRQWYWKETNLIYTNTLNYKLNVAKHSIDAVAGTEVNKYSTESFDATRQNITFENYDYAYLGVATGNTNLLGGGDKYNFLSYFGKFNYSYDSRFLLSGTLRVDGSSKFGANNHYGYFPAVSAGWRISNENFMKGFKDLSDLKLRASWGTNGNASNISSTSALTLFVSDYNGTSYGIGGNKTGLLPSGYRRTQIGNPDLKWETNRQTNLGVDFGFFHQMLSGSIDYYHKYTTGMLVNPPYPGVFGEGAYTYYNGADMTDDGYEIRLAYNSKPSKEFNYSIGASISHNRNAVKKVPATLLYTLGGSALKNDNIIGRPLHSYYGFIADGLFQNQQEVDNSPNQPGKGIGRIRYKDLSGPNGKPDGKIDYDYDQTWLGSWDPKIQAGLSFSASYKNFDFSMFWQGVFGSTVYDGWKTYSDFWNVWVQTGFNHPTRVLDAWTPLNTKSTIPALSLTNANDELRTSTYFMESGDYLKLRNLQIGYTFPKKFGGRTGLERLHVYALAQNLISIKKWWGNNKFTGPDPENYTSSSYGNEYLRPQVFKFGIDVSF